MRFLLNPWALILQGFAIVHFIRRRPDMYWLWVIIFLGPLGAAVYIVMEVGPDFGLLRQSFDAFPRRKRIRYLEALVLDNPAAGNYEELGDLYLDQQNFTRARECYDKAIRSRADMPDAFYRRGIAKIQLGDFAGAVPDIEQVVFRDPKYDSSRAAGLLAHAYASTGQAAKAEAREWTQRILAKKTTMPGYLRRRERPWFRKANGLLKRLAA